MTVIRVLVDMDPKAQDSELLAKLKTIADKTPLEVTLFSCDYQASVAANLLLHPDSLANATAHIKQQLKHKLQQLAEKYAHPRISYQVEADWHKPRYEATLKLAEDLNPHLILKEAKKHSIWQQLFFTPDDYQLLKSSPFPLLLSKNKSWQDAKCVLAAVDPSHPLSQESELDDHVITQAKQMAELLGLPLKVAHVFDPAGWEVVMNTSATAGVMGQFIVIDNPEDHQELLDKIRNRHRQQLQQLAKNHHLTEDQQLLLEGFPEEALEQAANDLKAALIVVGTTYRSGLLGSTAENLLENIGCDLLAVKPAGFTALKTH
jgi:universal stress protein E